LLLGVDAGATRSRARLADESGEILGEGHSAAANVLNDPVGAWCSIEEAIARAFAAAGLVAQTFDNVISVLGCAGLDPSQPAAPEQWPLAQFRRCVIETDAYVAQRGAFNGGEGAVLIAGTGAVGLLVRGVERVSIGGYGAVVSDEGGGAWIGREAVRRALWAFDGRGPRSALCDQVLAEVGAPPLAQAWAKSARASDYAAFAPVVFSAASRSDENGVAIVEDAVLHLARIVARLAEAGADRVCVLGGLAHAVMPRLQASPHVRGVPITAPQGSALDGALLMARDLARAA
jgi:glucosamine kinase